MLKIKSKKFKTLSITLFLLWIIYLAIRLFAKSVISVDKVCHENNCFIVEVAKTDQERQTWLMNRQKLWKNKWMIFVFEETRRHPFWMKNTLIPLDIIWINKDLEIVDIQTAQPCYTEVCWNYTPAWDAMYVLEINAWIAQQKDIKVWDNLKLKLKLK